MEFLYNKSVDCAVPIRLFMAAILLQYSVVLVVEAPVFISLLSFVVVLMKILRLLHFIAF